MNTTFDLNLDQSGMKGLVESWPTQFRNGWKNGQSFGKSSPANAPKALIWVGMGGSAIGGDLVAAYAKDHASFSVYVHRGGPLPAWVDASCRLLLVSYSGNTAETLGTAAEAESIGCPVDVLSSGGQLSQWARDKEITPWIIPGGRPPRAALGEIFATALGVLSARGWIQVSEKDAEETANRLDKLGEALCKEPGSDKHPLTALMDGFNERYPMIYGTGRFAPIARRWANQINENAKRPAHWGELPEMNHNEVVAYIDNSPWAKTGSIAILVDPDTPADVLKRVKVTRTIAEEAGWKAFILRPTTNSPLARMIETILVGDWLSFWMALEFNVDPTPIKPIDRLKASLSDD